MRIPHSIQGFLFTPIFLGLIFFLKITCPSGTESGCFADNFLIPAFVPLNFLYKVFETNASIVARHEAWFIMGYWTIVGLLIGVLLDVVESMKKK